MTVEIPPELEQYVQQELAKGEYRSEDELILDAVRVLRELKTRHEKLRQDVQAAVAQSDRGESEPLDIEAIKAEGRERLTEEGKMGRLPTTTGRAVACGYWEEPLSRRSDFTTVT